MPGRFERSVASRRSLSGRLCSAFARSSSLVPAGLTISSPFIRHFADTTISTVGSALKIDCTPLGRVADRFIAVWPSRAASEELQFPAFPDLLPGLPHCCPRKKLCLGRTRFPKPKNWSTPLGCSMPAVPTELRLPSMRREPLVLRSMSRTAFTLLRPSPAFLNSGGHTVIAVQHTAEPLAPLHLT